MRKNFFFRLVLTFFVLLVFFSCASMQDDVYIDNFSVSSEISDFEKRFSEIDAKFIEGNLENQAAKILISDIENALKDVSLNKSTVARLNAIAGTVALELGNKGEAKRFYESSLEAFKGDPRTLILASRLGLEKNFEDKKKLFSDKSLLTLESALNYYSEMEYAKALADFDEAFLSLDSFYRLSYGPLRDKSWELRNLEKNSDKRDSELLALKNLTVMQMLLITNRNPDLLYNYTIGKNLSDKELFVKIAGSGLLNPASKPLDSENAVSKDSLVTRIVAARFLWNLYNQKKNTPNEITKYSERYKNKKRSPVPDVKLDSPDFDAVLGCVENEIMHLEDGIEFGSEKEVSGIQFDESLKKIE